MDKTVKTVLIIGGVAAVGYIAWSMYQKNQQAKAATPTPVATGQVANPVTNETAQIIGAANESLNTLAAIISRSYGSN